MDNLTIMLKSMSYGQLGTLGFLYEPWPIEVV